MRKLILILFILLSCASLANSGGIISFPGGGVPSATCTASGLGCSSSNSNTWIMTGATYQEFKAQGSAITICQVCVNLSKNTTGNAHVEVWVAGGAQIEGDSVTMEVNNAFAGSGEEYCFTWTGTEPTVSISTDFNVYIVEESGDLWIHTNTDTGCYEDTNYDMFESVDRNMDVMMELHTR